MKKVNKKGFTLIELLAVIVILGVLLAIAVPAVTKYINSSKKSGYIANIKRFMDSARSEVLDGEYNAPVSTNEATVIYFDHLQPKLEKGGRTSSYGAEYDMNSSFILIVNEGTAEKTDYKYYVAARDNNGYGIGTGGGTNTAAAIIQEDDLKSSNIVQLQTGVTVTNENQSHNGQLTTASLSIQPVGFTAENPVNVTRIYKAN